MKRGIIVFLISLLAGVAGGLMFRGKPHAPEVRAEPERKKEREEVRLGAKWSGVDFVAAARKMNPPMSAGGVNRFASELAGWSDEEIRAALDETLPKPEWLLSHSPTIDVAQALFDEWTKRDFDAALAWFSSMQSGSQQRELADILSERWPATRNAEALDFLRKYSDLFPFHKKMGIVSKGIEAEAAKGPQALADLLGILKSESLLYDGGGTANIKVPEGFDFGALAATDGFRNVWGTAEGRTLLYKWVGQDREAALAWIVATKGAVAASEIASPGPGGKLKEHYAWLGQKMEGWAEADRKGFLDSAVKQWSGIRFDEVPDALVALSVGAKDPATADEVRAMGIQGIYLGKTADVLPLLEAMDPARRIDALSNALPLRHGGFRENFGPADEELLRLKLGEWQAKPEQIETIVGRFKS